ncbi:NAD-dependent epimerase/dehydratase family protein [Gracilibacillus kekensis]|uniref:NAD-dependent epimerase/dehydratase family protein n=1 Tax=Gracilibacillus kekensis TaxID=1027249 RepID=UPI003CC7F134
MSFHASFDTPVAIIRPFNTYGPRQSARAVIPTIISQIASEPYHKLHLWMYVRLFEYLTLLQLVPRLVFTPYESRISPLNTSI